MICKDASNKLVTAVLSMLGAGLLVFRAVSDSEASATEVLTGRISVNAGAIGS